MSTTKHMPVVALVFSLLLPGLGQFYNKEIKKALIFFLLFVILSYIYALAGILMILIATVDAYKKANTLKQADFISKNFKTSIIILITILIVAFLIGFFATSIINIIKT
jgi:TM2 domain-containing membrane protein YozV